MKTLSRILFALVCVAIVTTTVINPLLLAFAQEGDGDDAWGEFLNPDGSIVFCKIKTDHPG
jgi:hypothetical protein